MANAADYKDNASWESYENALQNCNWDWHMIIDNEEERESQRLTWENMEGIRLALILKNSTGTISTDQIFVEETYKLHNKYAPKKYHLG